MRPIRLDLTPAAAPPPTHTQKSKTSKCSLTAAGGRCNDAGSPCCRHCQCHCCRCCLSYHSQSQSHLCRWMVEAVSACTLMMSAPALAKSATRSSGSTIICTSKQATQAFRGCGIKIETPPCNPFNRGPQLMPKHQTAPANAFLNPH